MFGPTISGAAARPTQCGRVQLVAGQATVTGVRLTSKSRIMLSLHSGGNEQVTGPFLAPPDGINIVAGSFRIDQRASFANEDVNGFADCIYNWAILEEP